MFNSTENKENIAVWEYRQYDDNIDCHHFLFTSWHSKEV